MNQNETYEEMYSRLCKMSELTDLKIGAVKPEEEYAWKGIQYAIWSLKGRIGDRVAKIRDDSESIQF